MSRPPRSWKGLLLLGAGGLGLLGALVVVSGVVPIKASSGHWAVTRWFLEFARSRSVSTHSLGVAVPDLSDPALVLKGAGHYETGCRPCHGMPDDGRSRVAVRMTPTPPWLPGEIPGSEPAHLFHIVKHGIKFTGMAAWPAAERDDEVWAVVAFLRVLPTLDEAGYRELALGGSPEVPGGLDMPGRLPDPVRGSCVRCHGADGLGRGTSAFPVIAGQHPEYLTAALEAYATGARNSGVMHPVAAALEEGARAEAVRFYAALPGLGAGPAPAGDAAPPGPALLALGEEIARRGVPERKVPGCVHCHGPSHHAHAPRFPKLSGQHAEYLELQLRLFREERRGGSDYAHVMRAVARELTDEEVEAVALWYASAPPAAEEGGGR